MNHHTFIDQMGASVKVHFPPKRIISLVPSQTELLADLGLEERVVGITKFCVHPPSWLKNKIRIGGTKNFQFELIDELQPDLIIGNKEENYKEGIAMLKEKYPVWMSDITTLEDAYEMMRGVGMLTNRERESEEIVRSVESAFATLRKFNRYKVLYLIWRKPWMAAGSDTFIGTIISKLNLSNTVLKPRYPEITEEEMKNMEADYILLSSEPYPFGEKHVQEIRQICPASKVMLVDGEMFSWYGSRLKKAAAYFNQLGFTG